MSDMNTADSYSSHATTRKHNKHASTMKFLYSSAIVTWLGCSAGTSIRLPEDGCTVKN